MDVGQVDAYTRRLLRARTASIAALAVLAALLGAPSAGAAKPKVEVIPGNRFAFISAPGSKGWHLQLSAVLGSKGRNTVGVFARGPHHQEVQYIGVKGRATKDGTIEAKVPGLVRISLRFEQTSESPIDFEAGHCKVEGRSLSRKGIFRGTIAFHGEGGYTTVERRSAPGSIEVTPRQVCPKRKHQAESPPQASEGPGVELLLAGRNEGGGRSLSFEAFSTGLAIPGAGPLTSFTARYEHRRGKVLVMAVTKGLGEDASVFSLTAPEGTPTEVVVDPPAPFKGTGTFKLESPTTAAWTGDLSVDIPTLGTVGLTEPGWWAGACAAVCTKTFPPGLNILVGVVARRP